MTVRFVPKNPNCFSMILPNQTWFDVLRDSEVGNVLGRVYNNDSIIATCDQAKQCAVLLKQWKPPKLWGVSEFCFMTQKVQQYFLKKTLIQFFDECNGFTTY